MRTGICKVYSKLAKNFKSMRYLYGWIALRNNNEGYCVFATEISCLLDIKCYEYLGVSH